MKACTIILLIVLAQISCGQITIGGDTCSNTPNFDYGFQNYTFGNHGYGYRVNQNGNEVFHKEVIYDYMRATNMHFVNDTVGFLSEIPGGVYKSNNYGTSWNYFCWQGDYNWDNDSYNAMYFIGEDIGYFACYDSFDTLSLYKLTNGNTRKLLRTSYDSVSQDYTLIDTISLAGYFCGSLDHLLFTWHILGDTITADLQFFNNYVAGVEDAGHSAIQVYPNPSSGIIYIRNADFSSEYRIYDINGLLLKQAPFESSTWVSIHDLTKGIYVLEIITDKLTMRKKIVRI